MSHPFDGSNLGCMINLDSTYDKFFMKYYFKEISFSIKSIIMNAKKNIMSRLKSDIIKINNIIICTFLLLFRIINLICRCSEISIWKENLIIFLSSYIFIRLLILMDYEKKTKRKILISQPR